MEHNSRSRLAGAAGLGRTTRELFHDWGFPFAILVMWMFATAYTLFLVIRQPSPAQATTIAAPEQRMPVARQAKPARPSAPASQPRPASGA